MAALTLLPLIQSAQNPDGGWGYHRESSWTEPTALALMALGVAPSAPDCIEAGRSWLRRNQRRDGGWPPHPCVDQSTWVTALAVLALAGDLEWIGQGRATAWLLRQTGEESTLPARLRRVLLGQPSEVGEGTRGWPWFPGTAGWVIPTAFTLLALESVERHSPAPTLSERIQQGREFLQVRICADGGWNHGASRALGQDAPSYPDTTGLALLALHRVQAPQITRALACAEQQLPGCRSIQGRSWLRLGLLAHGRNPPTIRNGASPCRSLLDRIMLVLAEPAAHGRHIFLEQA